ncbi:hypothetical protein F0U62_35205 [Cystobacter fuscus]|nr:hypothetical protein F0U62_35205 [Cystobacter fuscus]
MGHHVPLEKPVVSVGSDSACDVVLREPGVKPSHALLFQDARGWTVSATARGCEVRVRNKRVELAPIAPGDSFSVGRVTLTLLSSEAAPAVAGSSPEVAPGGRLLAVLTGFASRLMVQRPTVEFLDMASTRRLPPHLTQANTSKSNVLRSSPTPSSRGICSFFGSFLAAASGATLSPCAPTLTFNRPPIFLCFEVPWHLQTTLQD